MHAPSTDQRHLGLEEVGKKRISDDRSGQRGMARPQLIDDPRKQGRIGVGAGQMHPDAPHRHFDLSANLEQFGANRVTARLSQIGARQTQTAQGEFFRT